MLCRSPSRLLAAAALLLAATAALAQSPRATVQGRVLDANGDPVPDCRIVVRVVEGTDVYLSAPSAEDGTYLITIPAGLTYVTVAAISPTGNRVGFTEPERWQAGAGAVDRDVLLPMVMVINPRHPDKELYGQDRLFLSFVEDPLLARRARFESQAFYSDFDRGERFGTRFVAAFQFRSIPRIEFGIRGSYASVDPPAPRPARSGPGDTDLWAKLHLRRSPRGRWDLAIGGLFTLPTGDADDGLGFDTTQAKWFVSTSRVIGPVVAVGNAGVRSTGDGESYRVPLNGEIAPSAAVGVIWPLDSTLSFVAEASWEAERFERLEDDAQVLVGVNWRLLPNATLRGAIAGGLADASPDLELVVGFAVDF